ncbi:TPA: thioester domain-containing protein, partial [Clostridioides difficile]|nr:thioester domain-containing protein [Clostridioides difficile]
MKVTGKIFSITFLLFLLCISPISAFANEKLYQGYFENIKISGDEPSVLLRITDGKGKDGKDNVVYCYDKNSQYPSALESADKTYYKRIESYLDSTDELTDKYGKDKKERIAAVLNAGYPNDALGCMKKYGVSENDAMYMTQILIWDITLGTDVDYVASGRITESMAKYANEILNISKVIKFEQGKLVLEGKLEFTKKEKDWRTEKLYTTGNRGEFWFKDIPSGFEIIDWNTDKKIDGNLSVGQEFYIKSSSEPSKNTRFNLEYKYNTVKFYFYKCVSKNTHNNKKEYQNLIRLEPINKNNQISLEIKINGNFNEVITGGSGDKTWTEDTATEGMNGSLKEGTIVETEEESGHGVVETDNNTTEGMSGSLKEGTIVETEEESGHGVVETDNNTTEGMSGSLKEGTIVETEENGCNGIVEIDKNKQEKSKDSNSVVNNKNEDKKDNLSKQNTSINKLKESPATG